MWVSVAEGTLIHLLVADSINHTHHCLRSKQHWRTRSAWWLCVNWCTQVCVRDTRVYTFWEFRSVDRVEEILTCDRRASQRSNLVRVQTSTETPPRNWDRRSGQQKLTSIRDVWYQRLDWETGISCRWQQVTAKWPVTWSPELRPEPVIRQLPYFILCWHYWFNLCAVLIVYGVNFIIRHPSCSVPVWFLLWNRSFFYMFNVNYSVSYEPISLYICISWRFMQLRTTTQHTRVWVLP
jgi:hypothetical protein